MKFTTNVNIIHEIGGAIKETWTEIKKFLLSVPAELKEINSEFKITEKLAKKFVKIIPKFALFTAGMAIGGMIEAGFNIDMLGILLLSPILAILAKVVNKRLND